MLGNIVRGRVLTMICLVFLVLTGQALSLTYVVTTAGNDGAGSLREAITNVNDNLGGEIVFNIPPLDGAVKTIVITNPLPTITNSVFIDGYSQDTASKNTLSNGNNAVILIELTSTNRIFNGLSLAADYSRIAGLAIHGFENAISLGGTNGFISIDGNYIGLDASGALVPSRVNQNGILIGCPYVEIGGTDPAHRNVISGNVVNGIRLTGLHATNNFIKGNYIGTPPSGVGSGIFNGTGIVLSLQADWTLIGGWEPGARNVISGNDFAGIVIDATADHTIVHNNFIGTDCFGSLPLPNGGYGLIVNSPHNEIGAAGERPNEFDSNGPDLPRGNLISGNGGGGIWLNGSMASNNVIYANLIGTDISGTHAVPNLGIGIHISQAHDNRIGFDLQFFNRGNLIAGNTGSGISIGGVFVVERTIIEGNIIGTRMSTGAPLANGVHGIFLAEARNTKILRNSIAYNGAAGIAARGSGSSTNNLIGNEEQPNFIYSNGSVGIDLTSFNPDGATTNDHCDADSGGVNRGQNFPVITFVTNTPSGELRIDGYINSTANTEFALNFFFNFYCDPSGHGEADFWIGATNVTTSGNCTNVFSAISSTFVPSYGFITATATDPGLNTSEFSQCYGFGESFRCLFPPSGLTNWWTGDGATANWVEGGISAGLSNGTMFATGKVDQAFLFDGINDFAAVPDSPSLRPSSLTLEAWVNFASVSGVTRRSLMSKPVGVGFNNSYGMFFQNGVLGGVVGNANTVSTLLTSFYPTTNRWYHVAYTYERSTSNHAIYVNGILQRRATATATNGYDNRDFMMGADRNAGTLQEFFAGLLDEPTIYDRVLRSEELQDIFGAGRYGKCKEPCGTNDTETPVITCPANITVNTAPGLCNRLVNFADPPVTDNCPGATVVCSPPSGTTFPRGVTPVHCTATDVAGNGMSCSFSIIVVDAEEPTITCPDHITVNTAPGLCTRVVDFADPVVTDNCPNPTVVCNPPSGAAFSIGINFVDCTVTDAGGNVETCTFIVFVEDAEPPTINCPADLITNTETGQCSRIVNYGPPAVFDNCPGVTVTCVPVSGTSFPTGTNFVSCEATDFFGNKAQCAFRVIVQDREPAMITCPADLLVDVPPGQPDAVVHYPPPTVSDNCPDVTVDCVPPSGSTFPLGTTTVVCTAVDTSGNRSSCQFRVVVNSGFRFRGIRIEGNDIRLFWQSPADTTNRLQMAPSLTNPFTDLSSNILIPGSGLVNTNYLDSGGATSGPARFYRIRLAP